MRIHYKNGGHSDVAIEQVDSITFIKGGDVPAAEVSLIGSWLWGSQEQGYYELLTFNGDHTYTGYDNYFSYGFDTMTYGWWAHIDDNFAVEWVWLSTSIQLVYNGTNWK